MDAGEIILSRGLPKTGQVTMYRAGDDGAHEAGWWQGRAIVDNKTRFVVKTLNNEDVVIDLATGLMWAKDGTGLGCYGGNKFTWNSCIDYGRNLFFGGFTDWRLPNILELMSIINFSKDNPSIDEPPFANTVLGTYWSSTTNPDNTNMAMGVMFDIAAVLRADKTGAKYVRCVRGGM